MSNIVFEKAKLSEEAFLYLPPGYNERALRAYVLQGRLQPRKKYKDMTGALGASFKWWQADEGECFWEHVFDYYAGYKKELPPLPDE